MNRSATAARQTPTDAQQRARVEAIVREVLARLQGARPRATQLPVHLSGPVISVATIEGLPAHVDRASVAGTAVITPSARDAVRQRGLRLQIAAPSDAVSARVPELLLADADCPQRHAAAARQLQRRGLPVDALPADQLIGRLLRSQATAILLADVPAPHVCAACRHDGVWAAAVGSVDEATATAAAMDVNLWVVDMHRLPLSRMLMLVQQLADRSSERAARNPERGVQ